MTTPDIKKLRGLIAKATSLPWKPDPEDYCQYMYIWGPKSEMVAAIRGVGAGLPREANRDLIIAAVNALPELLRDYERLLAKENGDKS